MFSSSSKDTKDTPLDIIDEDKASDSEVEIMEQKRPKKMRKELQNRGQSESSVSKPQRPPKAPVNDLKGEEGKLRKSPAWDHFTKTNEIGVFMCKYCKRELRVSSRNGTSTMHNHLSRCRQYPANLDVKQSLLSFDTKRVLKSDGSIETVSVPKCWRFDYEVARKALARMIIVDELPFMFVEREGFRAFCQSLHPDFVPPSRPTITRDCYTLFIDERKKLKNFFEKFSSRVSLTTDTWTSEQNLSYMCLTAHFIDDDWTLHKRIINFCPIAGTSGEFIGRAVEKCLLEWNLKNILTVTVDNASSNDVAIQYLKRRVNHWGGSILDGNYMHMRCAAHILNLVVKDGLKELDESILRVRHAVRYVRSSPARLEKFKACVKEEIIESKGLVCLDVETRWNSTYLMLECALKFKNAFSNMESKGGVYLKEIRKFGGPPTSEDWMRIRAFLPFLKIFYDTTLNLSGCLYVTGNTYVLQIYGVGFLISAYSESEDESIRKMAHQMKAKYDKYWANIDNINILLFIALVLDPRYKLDYVEWFIRSSYDDEKADMLFSKIKFTLRSVFDAYSSSLSQSKRTSESSSTVTPSACVGDFGVGSSRGDVMDIKLMMSLRYKREKGTLESEKKSELDKYLNDDCESNEDSFDILHFWKDSKKRYPILTSIAKDVLAMPVSTVALESAFSTGGRVLDSFRTSLTPRIVEALICSQDWLQKSHGPLIIEESLIELENMEKRYG